MVALFSPLFRMHFRFNRKSAIALPVKQEVKIVKKQNDVWNNFRRIYSSFFRNFPIYDDFSTFLSTIGFEKSSNIAKFWQKNLRKSISKNFRIVNCLKCVDCLHGLTDLKNNYKTIINISNTYIPKKYKCNNAKIIQTKVFHGL